MATHSKSFFSSDSDFFNFFNCESCMDKHITEYAVCYCEKCQQCFCRKCCGLHDQLFSKHVKYERGNMRFWPRSKELEAVILMCEIHTSKQIKKFCNNHNELCCSECSSLSHRKCRKLTLNSAKKHAADVNQLSVKLLINMMKLKKLHSCCESKIQLLKGSYQEQELMVRKMHSKIKSTMDKMLRSTLKETAKDEQNTVKKIHESMRSTLNDIQKNTLVETKKTLFSLQASLKTIAETCIIHHMVLNTLKELLQYSSDKNKKKLCFIAARKCMDKIQEVESYMDENHRDKLEYLILNQTMKDTEQYIFKFSGLGRMVKSIEPKNDIEQYLSKLSGLVRIICSNHVFTVCGRSEHNVIIPSDLYMCRIKAFCVLPDGQILVLDKANHVVKLLDQQYQVVSHCGVADESRDMCQVTHSEVALTVDFIRKHEIQFITVTTGQLVTGRKIKLKHTCSGIAHHQGDLFITSNTALYKYSLSGEQLGKLYEDESGYNTVCRCAVSPTGDKLYIINRFMDELLTLARDGTVLATFREPDIHPRCLHVTHAGQVLVGDALWFNFIIQVHNEGSRTLATLPTLRTRMRCSVSLCYNSTTSSIIVGQHNILVFKVQ